MAKEHADSEREVDREVHLSRRVGRKQIPALREGDDVISDDEARQFDLFRNCATPNGFLKFSFNTYPGGAILRRYQKGDVIFYQGDAASSAFYIPTAADLARFDALAQGQTPPENPIVAEAGNKPRVKVSIPFAAPRTAKKRSWSQFFSRKKNHPAAHRQRSIRFDGPADVDVNTRELELCEGEIFGEMGCISNSPRTAKVTAIADCRILEFFKPVLTALQKDKNHQARVDRAYRERTLDTHLGQLELFCDLDPQDFQELRKAVSLETRKAGEIICEQGEPWSESSPPDVFIVRSGMVQVIVNAPITLKPGDISDWQGLCRLIERSEADPPPVVVPPKPVATPAAASEAAAAAPKKLSPLEIMRAKQAGAATPPAASEPPAVPATPAAALPAAQPKLSPIEQMRAKKAAAEAQKQAASAPAAETAPAPAAEKPSAESAEPPKKLSPLEMMKAKQAAAKAAAASAPAGPPPLLREKRSPGEGPSAFLLKSWLSDHVQTAVRLLAGDKPTETEQQLQNAKQLVLDALNELLGHKPFLIEKRLIAEVHSQPEIMRKAALFPKGIAGMDSYWSEMELRTIGRAALAAMFSQSIHAPAVTAGTPRVRAYLSRGDCFGEMALVAQQPRSATCIACTHWSAKPGKRGEIELVRVPGSVLLGLIKKSPTLEKRLQDIARQRREDNDKKRVEESTRSTRSPSQFEKPASELLGSPEFHEMGLFQGQRLLVVDLNKCTRCGDCVDACIETHEDGFTRLFLDGPRWDHFLVPSACRNCLNPVCMSNCPVGSIVPGDNGQIQILDWCIGCCSCANMCPYDSIQMHDLGLLPEDSDRWEFAHDANALHRDWRLGRTKDAEWLQVQAPFRWNADFVRSWKAASAKADAGYRLFFRHSIRKPIAAKETHFRLAINCISDAKRMYNIAPAEVETKASPSKIAGVWLNGVNLAEGDSPRWNADRHFVDFSVNDWKQGENWLAIEVELTKPPKYNQVIMTAYLDFLPKPEAQTKDMRGAQQQINMKLAATRAVVCDLCSDLPSQEPACVSSCPQEAAIRINPLVNFPI